jgi:hypothetical protein
MTAPNTDEKQPSQGSINIERAIVDHVPVRIRELEDEMASLMTTMRARESELTRLRLHQRIAAGA